MEASRIDWKVVLDQTQHFEMLDPNPDHDGAYYNPWTDKPIQDF